MFTGRRSCVSVLVCRRDGVWRERTYPKAVGGVSPTAPDHTKCTRGTAGDMYMHRSRLVALSNNIDTSNAADQGRQTSVAHMDNAGRISRSILPPAFSSPDEPAGTRLATYITHIPGVRRLHNHARPCPFGRVPGAEGGSVTAVDASLGPRCRRGR